MELDQQTIASELKAAVDNVLAGTKIVTWSNALLDEVNVLDAAIEEASDAARDTVAKTVSQVMAPVDAAKRMLGVLQHAIDSAQSLAEFTQARVDRAVSGLAITTPTFGETLEASYSIRNVRSCAIRSRSVALQHRESLRDTVGLRAAPATHIMRQGEDLRTVSTYYYGRPDEWRRIALFNGYDGASVPQGKLIAIPPATEDASQQGVA
jgi:nucleoid-associated protein YgaU